MQESGYVYNPDESRSLSVTCTCSELVLFYSACGHFFSVFFFFSSRRRHTRLQGDWSSDVCSSDLWYAFLMMLIMFSLAGIPPTAGFYAKLAVFQAAVAADHVWLAVAAVLLSLVGARSGERRGGEEGRSRWAPDHLKKKKKDNKRRG